MADTKERILQTALRLFAADGYEAVSVSTIAGELGMTKGALYKHYKNKQDIFDSIVARMEQQDMEQAETYEVPEGTVQEMEAAYQSTSLEQLLEYSKAQFRYWTEDPFAALFRKMLTLEQYRSEKMGQLYQQYLAAGPMEYVADLFSSMGFPEPQKKAASFYAPMFLMYTVYDGAKESEKASVTALADACLEQCYEKLKKERKK